MAKDHPTGQSGLYQAFLQLKTPEQCYRFLQDVCSYSELSAMEQRYNIAEMLVDKRIYTEIMDKTGAECQRQRIARLAGSGKSCRRSKLNFHANHAACRPCGMRLLSFNREGRSPHASGVLLSFFLMRRRCAVFIRNQGGLIFMSKAVVFFAEGTEECEALLVVDLLRRAKVEVTVASASGSREIVSSHKVHITADALAEEVDYSDVDMVVLPGGIPGTPNLAANKTVTDTCVSFAKSGKKVAAICAAPSVLASLGLLEGRKATAHAGFQDKLAGAEVLDTEVVVDGNITTSYGLGGAIPFALELVRQLAGQAEADRIQNAIAYRH